MKYDIIIIGAGIAGLTAGIYACRAGRSVLILEKGVCGGQIVGTSRIENWPGDYGVSGADLMKKICQQVVELGAEVRYEEVIEVVRDGDSFAVKTDEGMHSAPSVILAMGTEPRKLSKKQAEYAGKRPISYCATCDGALYKGRPVVVVGSGNTAKHEMCPKVYHIHHDEPIPDDAEAVFVAIGRVPANQIVKKLVKMDDNGYIEAEEDCKTSCPGLFVAGDCRTKSVRQLVTAAADGAVAAEVAVRFLG